MQEMLLMDKYPICKLDFKKNETSFKSAQEILNHLRTMIDKHEVARFIGEFDHYSHTKGIDNGEIDDSIIDARNIIFCFGKVLKKPEILAVRPRSIGIAETNDGFTVSFMQAPVALMNETMKRWVSELVNIK
jgi:hypothetical protein